MNPDTSTESLRDRLAIDRTALANERTLLAYARTALMLVASGATLWRLRPQSGFEIALGLLAIAAGAAVLIVGVARFGSQRRRLWRASSSG